MRFGVVTLVLSMVGSLGMSEDAQAGGYVCGQQSYCYSPSSYYTYSSCGTTYCCQPDYYIQTPSGLVPHYGGCLPGPSSSGPLPSPQVLQAIQGVNNNINVLRGDVDDVDERVQGVDTRVQQLQQQVNELRQRINEAEEASESESSEESEATSNE